MGGNHSNRDVEDHRKKRARNKLRDGSWNFPPNTSSNRSANLSGLKRISQGRNASQTLTTVFDASSPSSEVQSKYITAMEVGRTVRVARRARTRSPSIQASTPVKRRKSSWVEKKCNV